MLPSVTIIGDSLTVDADKDSRNLFPTNYRIVASVGYSLRESMARVRLIAENPPDIVVLALGSNDVAERREEMHDYQVTAAEVSANSTCIFTTVKSRGVTPFYNPNWDLWADLWNCFLGCDARETVNWTNGLQDSWFLDDGLHHNAAGRKAYVQRIKNAVNSQTT